MPVDTTLQTLRRLRQGRCPMHNVVLPQVGMSGTRAVVECSVKEREISGTADSFGGAVYLDKRFEFLLK